MISSCWSDYISQQPPLLAIFNLCVSQISQNRNRNTHLGQMEWNHTHVWSISNFKPFSASDLIWHPFTQISIFFCVWFKAIISNIKAFNRFRSVTYQLGDLLYLTAVAKHRQGPEHIDYWLRDWFSSVSHSENDSQFFAATKPLFKNNE